MRIHFLQHVPFENSAYIEEWARHKEHALSKTMLFDGESLPLIDKFDWLVIMGGPMNVYEEQKYPWLSHEKRFIAESLIKNKIILGVCLGAQLIADVLGSRVYKNEYKEIGWFKISLTPHASESLLFSSVPKRFPAFHWHSDTFDLPSGCIRIAESNACINQAFEYNGRVLGLQFHLESSNESINQLLENCSEDLGDGMYVQTPDEIKRGYENIKDSNQIVELLLNSIEHTVGKDLG